MAAIDRAVTASANANAPSSVYAAVTPSDTAGSGDLTYVSRAIYVGTGGNLVAITIEVVPNQGKGAAKMRIEAARRLFPSMWFDEAGCAGGIDAIGWYHEKKDEDRSIGLGPEHDWASHGADAFGLGCVVYEQPNAKQQRRRYSGSNSQSNSWMAG